MKTIQETIRILIEYDEVKERAEYVGNKFLDKWDSRNTGIDKMYIENPMIGIHYSSSNWGHYNDSTSFPFDWLFIETDEELTKRIDEFITIRRTEAQEKQRQEAKAYEDSKRVEELKTLERLKAKYENKI